MKEIQTSAAFDKSFKKLKDYVGKSRIVERIEAIRLHGHFGVYKPLVGADGICELIFTMGGGYRVYFAEHGDTVVVLLVMGNKSSQVRDIEKAKALWAALKETFEDEKNE